MIAETLCGTGWTGCHAALVYTVLGVFSLGALAVIAVAMGGR